MRNVVTHSSVKHPTNTTTSVFIKHFLYFILEWFVCCCFFNKEKGRLGCNEGCVFVLVMILKRKMVCESCCERGGCV